MPGNDKNFNMTQLAQAYDNYAKQMYANFENVMMQIACDTDDTSQYSLARTCDDCRKAYKTWLCTVSLPRCEDFTSDNQYTLIRNLNQSYANGTNLLPGVLESLVDQQYTLTSRNSFIDSTIQPGPYKEILPCDFTCYEVAQSCPAAVGFTCPVSSSIAFSLSYGQLNVNASAVTCNFAGEARTRVSGASIIAPSQRHIILGALALVMSLLGQDLF